MGAASRSLSDTMVCSNTASTWLRRAQSTKRARARKLLIKSAGLQGASEELPWGEDRLNLIAEEARLFFEFPVFSPS